MADLITRRLLAIAAVWTLLTLVSSPPTGSLAAVVGGLVGAFVGAVVVAALIKLVYIKIRNTVRGRRMSTEA